MNTAKEGVRLIVEICRQLGIRHAVFSPGSRSAPLVIAFSAAPEIECLVIPDERVAGYFALGMAQQTNKPVALVCTSGTAVLNTGPALAEAYYQHIPLLLLSADRPEGAIMRGENQAIDQAYIFQKITKASFDIDAENSTREGLAEIAGKLRLSINGTTQEGAGPVHVNLRLSEPLYDLIDEQAPGIRLESLSLFPPPTSDLLAVEQLRKHGNEAKRKLIIIGSHKPDKEFGDKLYRIAAREDTAVLVETISNLTGANCIYNYDACLELMAENGADLFAPDMVVTLGNQVISKRIRAFLRKHKPTIHWDISPENIRRSHNLFDVTPRQLFITENDALDCLEQAEPSTQTGYSSQWQNLNVLAGALTEKYFDKAEFSDFKVFGELVKSFPTSSNIHYGNSSPIRYSNFFEHHSSLTVNSNRGTSGIDGCVSTAAGAAYINQKLTVCVAGDIGFFYDSNALFNQHLSPNLRIIVINNSGGNIFRLIDGPTRLPGFEKFFETKHSLTAKHLALMYGLPYYFCDRFEALGEMLGEFFQPQGGKPAILEIATNNIISEQVFKGYFSLLRENRSASIADSVK